ncbi:MAG: DUF5011 domain-containing protein [Bacilli bacterium]|nr:DUF5011 domain-containing protein [Bacilli bacterium]
MKKNKAFTLVELLAVIVILAIILAIAIPGISGIVDNAKANAFESDAKMLIKAIDYKKLNDSTLDPTTIDLAYVEGTLKQSIANYDSLTVTVDGNNKVNVSITGKNKWEGLMAEGSYQSMEVSEVVPDTTLPVITLNYDYWGEVITVRTCTSYYELGATATDNVDGDLTSEIVVDASELPAPGASGSYYVYYTVTDSSDNVGEATRTVNYLPGCPY